MIKKLDIYIIKKFLVTFFFILFTIMLIAVIFDFSEKIDDFIRKAPPIREILIDYYLNFVLFFGNLFSPLLIFISVIFFTSKLTSNSEIIAILSAGISFKRFIVPYMVAATLLAGTSFYLNHWLIPRANSTRIDFEENYLRYKFHNVNRDIHKQIAPDVFIYFESFNSARQIGYKVSIEEWEDGALKKKLLADFARWDSTKEIWSIQNYAIREFNNGQEKLRKGIRLDTLLSFTPDDFSKRKFISIQMMNYNELNAFIDEEKKKGNDKVPIYEIEKHTRTSLPLATYILTLMGVSVSSRKIRGGIGVHLALGLLLAVSYILFMKISSVYATNTGIDPLFATWIPNIVYAVIAIVLFKRAHK